MTGIALTEDMLHVYVADLLAAFKRPSVVAFHVPNGGKRSISTAKKLKKMGTLPGVADWVFSLPAGRVAYLELKVGRNKQSDDQIEFERNVTALGAPYALARTPEQVDGILSAWGIIDKAWLPV